MTAGRRDETQIPHYFVDAAFRSVPFNEIPVRRLTPQSAVASTKPENGPAQDSAGQASGPARCSPTSASCQRRSAGPAKSAKTEPAPAKKKIAQAPPAKKPVKLALKTADTKPRLKKPTLTKKGDGRLPIAPDQPDLVLQSEATATKLDRNLEPAAQEQQPVATAKLALPPEPVAPADKQTLGRRIALIIGNSSYSAVPALKNPPMDARAIADTLTSLGFEKVTLKLDLDRQSTWTALTEFAEESARADWAVVYYAGHGIELDGQNYIIPIDAKLESDRRVLFETVPLDHVVESTAGARKFRLVTWMRAATIRSSLR